MRKIFLGLILLVGLVTLSYLKVVYSNNSENASNEARFLQFQSDSIRAAEIADSLQILLSESRSTMATAMQERDKSAGMRADSLEAIIAEQLERIKNLKSKIERSDLTIAELKSRKAPVIKTGIDHKAVISYYKKRIEKLPMDLSDYEKRIMVDELREETAQHFSLTMNEFDKFSKQYKLDN